MSLQNYFGKDTSSHFKQTLIGLAVKSSQGKFQVLHERHVAPVGDLPGLSGADDSIFRLPVLESDLKEGDLLVLDDQTDFSLCLLFKEMKNGVPTGRDQDGNWFDQAQPVNIFGDSVYVKVMGLMDNLIDKKDVSEVGSLFAALASANTSGSNSTATSASPGGDALTAYLMAKALHGKGADSDALLKIMLLTGSSQSSSTGGFSPSMLLALGSGEKLKDREGLFKLLALSGLSQGATGSLSPAMLLALMDGRKLFGTTKTKA